ncbi:MAG: hypothetical protein A2511_11585 [Deltaproteobacteria bacterium RIFOXYD12_FULL_50_9]|nr:MAG: hypothetical protein A2511_11585 [Deltaproteobacteria bacterium RIFOXYD12_FULL_50_9]
MPIKKDNIFSLLDQAGPFATGEAAPSYHPYTVQTKEWVLRTRASGMLTKYRVLRNQLFELLDVHSFAEIQILIGNREQRRITELRAYALLGNMFGLDGNEREVISKINTYSRIADAVIRYLKGKVLANYASFIEMTNEVDATNSPMDLLLIVFDDRYHQKARFEAKRKLILMSLAGSIDQRERETDIENKFAQFLFFLNEHVWSRDLKIGELEFAYLLSEHEPDSFACKEVRVIRSDLIMDIDRQKGQKITLIKRRRFRGDGREIPIYVSIRKKPPEAKVLKLLRKGEENPAVAVDDELGLMGVVESVNDVKIFQKHLTHSASAAGSFMTLDEVTDTLAGGGHAPSTPGSSAKTPMFKFFARLGGMRVEFIVHTHKSYINYLYQRDVAHDEYEVKRIFDSGVAEMLFPQDIYHLDMSEIKEVIVRWFRNRLEES